MVKLSKVSCRYGAPMGRAGAHPGDDPHCTMRVSRVRLNSGGYDNGGAYWGLGQPLWYCHGLDSFDGATSYIADFRRAPTKQAAIAAWREMWPNAKVY